MSTRTSTLSSFSAHRPRTSSKAFPQAFFGSAAVASLLIGCAWTVYANVFGANIYPSMDAGHFDAPVVRHSAAFADRFATPIAKQVVAGVSEPAPVMAAPATASSRSWLSFEDRFAGAAAQGVAPKQQVEIAKADTAKVETPKLALAAPHIDASKPKEAAPAQVAALVPMPSPRPADAKPSDAKPSDTKVADARVAKTGASVRDMAQRAKAKMMSVASNDKPAEKPSIFERLFGKLQSSGSTLAYASADVSSTASLGPAHNIAQSGTVPLYDRTTAVYDISAHMVYLPDGTKLEAHSGLGSKLDDPSSANIRMRGVTPPHLYDLQPREALFHGVPALRLNPIGGEDAIFGRSGLLAHTYMLGPNGDSNGCVSFRDYDAFLRAYRNGEVKRLAVVAKLD